MSYTKKTQNKYIETARAMLADLQATDPADIQVNISKGDAKIGNCLNVSTAPVLGCRNCKHCKGDCYDIKACVRFPENVLRKRVENLYVADRAPRLYFQAIEASLVDSIRNRYFRWHQAGDIRNADYFNSMVGIADRHEPWFFWTYTECHDIVNAWIAAHGGSRSAIPHNLVVMYSKWPGVDIETPTVCPCLRSGNMATWTRILTGCLNAPGTAATAGNTKPDAWQASTHTHGSIERRRP